jgi:hypothetical protein
MVIDWTCVLDDGARPFAAELGGDARRPLVLTIGDDTEIRVSIVNPVGEPIDLGADDNTSYPQLVIRAGDQKRLFSVKGTRGDRGGAYTIAINAAALQPIAPQWGSFALYAVRANGDRDVLIPSSELKIGR